MNYCLNKDQLIDLVNKIKSGYTLDEFLESLVKNSEIDYDKVIEKNGVKMIFFQTAPPVIIGEVHEQQNENI